MIFNRIILLSCAAVIALPAATQTAQAGTFQFTTITPPGVHAIQAIDINNDNQVAGYYIGAHERKHGYVWVNGSFTKVDVPGAKDTELDAVNDSGIAVGVATKVPGLGNIAFTYNITSGLQTVIGSMTRAYFINFGIGENDQSFGTEDFHRRRFTTVIEQDDKLIPFNVPGRKKTAFTIQQINGAGELLGTAHSFKNGYDYGYTYLGTKLTLFEVPGFQSTQPVVFTPDGGIAGIFSAVNGPRVRGFYLTGGNYTTYSYPGARYTELRGALSPSYVEGSYLTSGGSAYAFIFNAGKYTRYVPKGATSSGFGAMNANGSLVGGYTNKQNEVLGLIGICPSGQAPCMP
jgi:hypothetical protein